MRHSLPPSALQATVTLKAPRAPRPDAIRVIAERSDRIVEILAFPTLLGAVVQVEAWSEDGATSHRRLTIFAQGRPVYRRVRGRSGWMDAHVPAT